MPTYEYLCIVRMMTDADNEEEARQAVRDELENVAYEVVDID